MSSMMTLDFLDVPVEVKADEGSGLFAARVSAFGNEDLNGDRVLRGAFKRTIQAFKAAGKMIPVVWSHQHNQLPIGEVNPDDMRETEKGLDVAGKLFLDDPNAMEVWKSMRRGLITAWSFAFAPTKERIGDDGVREIMDLDLFELGPTLVGANPQAQTIALKSLGDQIVLVPGTSITTNTGTITVNTTSGGEPDTKRGRRISAATAGVLTRMRQELDDLLADGSDEDDEDAEAKTASEEPLSEADRLRLQLAELDAYLSQRGR